MLLTREIDTSRRRVVLTARDVPAMNLMAFIADLFRTQPDLADYDFLCIFENLEEDYTSEQLIAVSDAYDPPPGGRAVYTAICNSSLTMHHWIAGLDLLLPGRTHKVFATAAEGEAFLDGQSDR